MPRTHMRLYLRIWSDKDYKRLPMAAQWLYEALGSQPDINQAGVLSLSPRRWSGLCADGSAERIETALRVLRDRRYVVVDPETEELLVRTFIRNDEVWRSPNTLKSACTAARSAQSPAIRGALLAELQRLDMPTIEAMRVAPGHETAAEALRRTIKALSEDVFVTPSEGYGDTNGEPLGDPIGDTKTDGSARAGAGEGVGVRTSPAVGMNSRNVGPRNQRGAQLPEDFVVPDEWLAWARTSFPGLDVRREAAKFVDHWRAASGQSSRKRDWKATWRNWIRRADELTRTRSGRPAPRSSAPLPPEPDLAMAELRRRSDAQGAAVLAGLVYVADSQPPSDKTDPREWGRRARLRWLDQHEQEIRTALSRGVHTR